MSSYQIIKLKNGEDLICNVLDNENGRLKVTTPLKMETVNRISKKGLTESLALTRWIQPYSDEDHFFIESNSIIIMTPASLRMNYINELKQCGDPLYKTNQYWEKIHHNHIFYILELNKFCHNLYVEVLHCKVYYHQLYRNYR